MKNNSTLIFDFDGTLVDSFDAAVGKFNLLANEFNFRSVKVEEVDQLKELTSKEFIKYLKIPIYKIPAILIKARALMRSEIQTLPSFDNLQKVIKQIHGMNVNLGILTSNSLENVTEWLKHNDMQGFFNFIHIESSYFGKNRILRKIIRMYKLDQAHTFYIGDETRDVESAKACNINSIAVTWGFNSEKVLLKHQPHFVVSKPEDILTIFEKLTT